MLGVPRRKIGPVGSSEEFHYSSRISFRALDHCECPKLVAAPPPGKVWPWYMRNLDTVHKFVEGLSEQTREWLIALYVAEDLRLLSIETVAIGSVSGVEVPMSRIIYRGLQTGAAGFILAHNHPSGDPTPSLADIKVTARLAEIGREMDVHLLDHIVVAGGEIRRVGHCYW